MIDVSVDCLAGETEDKDNGRQRAGVDGEGAGQGTHRRSIPGSSLNIRHTHIMIAVVSGIRWHRNIFDSN